MGQSNNKGIALKKSKDNTRYQSFSSLILVHPGVLDNVLSERRNNLLHFSDHQEIRHDGNNNSIVNDQIVENETEFPLDFQWKLPDEMKIQIMNFLTLEEILLLDLVSKSFRNSWTRLTLFWKGKLDRTNTSIWFKPIGNMNFTTYRDLVIHFERFRKEICKCRESIVNHIDTLYYIVLFGPKQCGKSSYLKRITSEQFEDEYKPTIGIEFNVKYLSDGENSVKFLIWDTSGDERYHSITSSYIRGCHIFAFCFDLSDSSSLDLMKEQIDSFKINIRQDIYERTDSRMFLILGMKSDLERQVTHEMIHQFLSNIIPNYNEPIEFPKLKVLYFEQSSKEGTRSSSSIDVGLETESTITNYVPLETDVISNEQEKKTIQTETPEANVNVLPGNIYTKLAKLMLSYDKRTEGSFGWYLHQLMTKQTIGTHQFDPKVKRRLIQYGFGDHKTTSPNWFGFFRKFNNTHCRQSNCELFALEDSRDYFTKNQSKGIHLDANIEHYEYKDNGLGLEMIKKEDKVRKQMTKFVNGKESLTAVQLSRIFDQEFALKTWLNMRPINILLNNEANAFSEVGPRAKDQKAHLDLSMCWSRKCSIWTTYFYTKMDVEFRDGDAIPPHCICSFISNCAEERLKVVKEIDAITPVRQYGKCGRNAEEGKGGKIEELAKSCKFYMAFENTITDDYITEKFFEGFLPLGLGGKLISIYRGAKNIGDYGFEKESFINFHDFESPTELAKYIKPYCDDDKKFVKYFNERMTDGNKKNVQELSLKLHLANVIKSPCKLCTAIGEMKLSRYLLFKLGLKPQYYRVSNDEFEEFIQLMGYDKLESDQLSILWDIWDRAYGRLLKTKNNGSNWNDYDINFVTYIKDQ